MKFKMSNIPALQAGQSLIELMVTIGLVAVILPALLTGFVATRSGRGQGEQRQQATALVREGQEAARIVREKDWTAFANLSGQTVYPKINAGTWILTTTPQTLSGAFSGFTRTITIAEVYRDSTTFAVVVQGSANSYDDPSTKQVTTTVAWNNPIPNSAVSTTEYLSRFGNVCKNSDGTNFGDCSTPRSGTAQPPAGGRGDWCNPNLHITPYDISGNENGIDVLSIAGSSVGAQNSAYISTGDNKGAKGGNKTSLYSINITDPPPPAIPAASLANSYTADNTKTYGLSTSGSYIYAAVRNVPGNNKRLINIIKASDLTFAGFFNPNINPSSATSVDVSGSIGYVTDGTNLRAFSASPIKGNVSQDPIWWKSLNGSVTGNKVVVSGSYAYIATSATSNSRQLQVVKLSDQSISSPPATGTGSIGTNQPGIDLTVQGNYAYLVTSYSSSNPDIFVIDISTSSAPKVVGTASTFFNSTSMNPLGVAIATILNNNVIIVVGNGGWQYQVFQVSQSGSVSRCPVTPLVPNAGALQNPNGASTIQAVSALKEQDGDVYAYILTTNGNSQQFQIIEGGSGGGGSGNGIFESSTFDAGHNVAFNYFSATSNPSLTYKLAIKQAVGGTCPTFVDGDFVSISTGPITLPGIGYSNPGQCLRYRVINSGSVAIPYTININYSP